MSGAGPDCLRATIDIGSNSVLLLCGRSRADHTIEEILNESRVTALGKDLDRNKAFLESSMQETLAALNEFKALLQSKGIPSGNVVVTATEASRVALNARDFFKKVQRETGFSVHIISATAEAYYSALGVSLAAPAGVKEFFMMDVGGASTELIHVRPNPLEILKTISLPMGSVRAFSWKSEGVYKEKLEEIIFTHKSAIASFKCETLLAIAGTMTTLAGMFLGLKTYQDKKVEGLSISIESFRKLLEQHRGSGPEDLLKLYPFLGKRAPTVVAGGELSLRLAQELGVKELVVSTYGLRYGTLYEGGLKNEFIIWRPS